MSIAVVQSVMASGSSVTTVTTAAISTTTGNLIVVDMAYSPAFFVSLTDSVGLTWTASISELAGSSFASRQSYKTNITGNASHTFTLTVSSSSDARIIVREVSGQASSPLDVVASNHDASSVTSHTSSATGTTSQANELLLGIGLIDGLATSYSVSAPWTQDQNASNVSSTPGMITAHQIVSATGTYSFAWTSSASFSSNNGISAWKEAPAVTHWTPRLARQRLMRQFTGGSVAKAN